MSTLTRWLTPWRTIRRLEAENQRLREQAVDGSDTYQQCEYCDGTGKVDDYGNPSSGDRVIYCTFPDCGCDGARLCQAEKGASERSCMLNIERGSLKP